MVRAGGFGRNKGKRGERKVATRLREGFPEFAGQIRRGWQSRMGDDDPDVVGLPGIWVEVKTGKMPNPRAAFKQACRDANGRAIPIAVIQDDRTRNPLVIVGLTEFISIMRSAYRLEAAIPTPVAKGDSGGRQSHNRSGREVLPRDEEGRFYRLRVDSNRRLARASGAD